MTSRSSWRDATRAVHAGRSIDPSTGAVTPPIHLSTTFARGEDGQLVGDHGYGREGNPNRDALEACLAELERGTAARAFSSGLAAAHAVLLSIPRGSRILHAADLYHGVRRLLHEVAGPSGHEVVSLDVTDEDALDLELERGAALLWCETPSNPLLQIIDLKRLATACHARGTRLVVDNTFATPVLQRPLELGADLVVHATTKGIAGHSDVTGGVVVTGDEHDEIWQRMGVIQSLGGAVPSPFDCWLTLRGVSTLPLRVRAQDVTATDLAGRLLQHRAVATVLHPSLPDHPGHATARRQMHGFGAVISIRLAGGAGAASSFASGVDWVPQATSLGGVHTLVEHRTLVEPEGSPVPDDLVRIAIGIEDVEDLWEIFSRALDGL